MLSRRHLRIKVLQALYALEAARDANFRLSEDYIDDSFKPDLNSMTPQDPQKLQGLAKIAKILLNENIKNKTIDSDDDSPADSMVAARNALQMYWKGYNEDIQKIARKLVPDVERISDSYYAILKLFSELAKLTLSERERVYDDPDDPIAKASGLDTTQHIIALNASQSFINEVVRKGISWDNDDIFVRQAYKNIIRKDETYRQFCAIEKHTLADDEALIQYILKEILFKHEFFTTYFEKNDLFWEENRSIIRKMISKTWQSVTTDGNITFSSLTDAWDEDVHFMEQLFKNTVERNLELEAIVEEPLKNWDLERLALTDVLILKMGLAEMLSFPGIPIKVSINESIELAKEYSTPKSGKFVNGILDTLSKQLMKSGQIRKSGRGLVDSK